MTYFVFCHGFAFTKHFWDPLIPYFSQEKYLRVDRGYFGDEDFRREIDQYDKKSPIIGIGHSMGLIKLMAMDIAFDYFIGLNGFVNFLGFEKKQRYMRQKELTLLRHHFLKNPVRTLKNFHARCGVSLTHDFSRLNHTLLLSDLHELEKNHSFPKVPTFILGSYEDTVVPPSVILDHVHDTITLDFMHGGHNLGYKNPKCIHEKIMSFLNEH